MKNEFLKFMVTGSMLFFICLQGISQKHAIQGNQSAGSIPVTSILNNISDLAG